MYFIYISNKLEPECFHQEKKVTLVQGDKGLLNSGYPDKFRKAAKDALQARGVDVILDDFVDIIPPSGATEVKTRSGKTIKADLCVCLSAINVFIRIHDSSSYSFQPEDQSRTQGSLQHHWVMSPTLTDILKSNRPFSWKSTKISSLSGMWSTCLNRSS